MIIQLIALLKIYGYTMHSFLFLQKLISHYPQIYAKNKISDANASIINNLNINSQTCTRRNDQNRSNLHVYPNPL